MSQRNYRLISWMLAITFLAGLLTTFGIPAAASAQNPYNELAIQSVRNNYGLYQAGQPVDGQWGNFSAYDAYILNQAGADLETWVYAGTSFKAHVMNLIDATIANQGTNNPSSSKRVAQEYLAAKSLGETEKAVQLLAILQSRQTTDGKKGFDNNAFSDIAVFEMLGRAGDVDKINTAGAVSYILGEQDASGAWTSTWQDFMLTAEAVRALYYLKPHAAEEQATAVENAISSGCNWLQARQQANGSFQDDAGFDDPAVDTAEVIYTLKLLEINPASWSADGNNAVSYLQNEALNTDRTFGSSKNIASNTWVLDACLQLGVNIDSAAALELKIIPSSINLKVDDTQQLTATLYSLNGLTADATATANWSSDDATVAAANNGLVKGLKAGQTRINASIHGVAGSALATVARKDGGVDQGKIITIHIAIVGKNNTILFRPGTVSLSENNQYGLTAVGALNATGLDWAFSSQFPDLVSEIAGHRNEGMRGWMFKINGLVPGISAGDCKVGSGDQVVWWYSSEANSTGPTWGDISSGKIKPVDTPLPLLVDNKEKEIKAILNAYNNDLNQVGETTAVKNANKRMSPSQVKTLKEELDDNTVALTGEAGPAETIMADSKQEMILLVPEKACLETKKLSIQELSPDVHPQQYAVRLISSSYEFAPSGISFEKPATISFRVAIPEDADINNLTPAWFDQQARQWLPIPGLIDLETGRILFKIDHFTDFALIELPLRINFSDIGTDTAWVRDAVEILAGQGIVKGTGHGFEPQKSINRAEFIQLLVKALGLNEEFYSKEIFQDVNPADWFAPAVGAAHKQKIITGYTDGTFRPHQKISRNEIAVILLQLDRNSHAGWADVKLAYRDKADIPAWALNGVKFVDWCGLMKGFEDGTFRGNKYLTRAEAALIIFNYLANPPGPKDPAAN